MHQTWSSCVLTLHIEALKSLLIIKRTPEPEEEEQQESPSPAIGLEDGLTPEMKRKMEEYKKSLLVSSSLVVSCIILIIRT